jgi:AcrR family transcriptional regulator
MSTEAPEIRQRRRKETRPDEILAAALTVFARDGFSGARLEEIAHRADCTKGTIYVYFDSKEALFKAVVRKLITPSFRKVDTVLGDDTLDSRTRIERFVRGAFLEIVQGTSQASIMRMMIADGPRFPDLVEFYHAEIGRIGFELMRAALEHGIARGEIRPIDTQVAPLIIFGPITAELLRRLLGSDRVRPVPIEKLIDTHLDILLNGLLTKPKVIEA